MAAGSELNIMEVFEGGAPATPTAADLEETVRELNSVLATYQAASDVGVLRSAPNIPINSGNLLVSGNSIQTNLLFSEFSVNRLLVFGSSQILTTVSHTMGAYAECVVWGDRADRDLLSSDEPFTIPGEKYWLELYLAYLVSFSSQFSKVILLRKVIIT